MSSISRPGLFGSSFNGINFGANTTQRCSARLTVILNSTSKEKQFFEEIQKLTIPESELVTQSNLRFDRLQPLDQDSIQENRVQFGQFVAREAFLDEEYWTAAWLRAESHWEDRCGDRYADNHKRKFAEQEFNALRRRCNAVFGQKCTCIVTVKKDEKNVKRTVLNSVVGTLDLTMGVLSHGQAYPWEQMKLPLVFNTNQKDANRFGYIANLCVAKSARRQGIARNMLQFAIMSARSNGAQQIFVHVHKNNGPAQELYKKAGFQVVENAKFQPCDEETFLLSLKA